MEADDTVLVIRLRAIDQPSVLPEKFDSINAQRSA